MENCGGGEYNYQLDYFVSMILQGGMHFLRETYCPDVAVFHFTGPNKPWLPDANCLYRELYQKYARIAWE